MKKFFNMRPNIFAVIAIVAFIGFAENHKASADEPAVLYENNFEKSAVGKVPEGLLVLDGQFTVKQENENNILELPGAPLETFGVLFGPTEPANVMVLAKALGTGKGRRFPTFGIGANGVSGYRLQVSPGKKSLELYKGDEVVKSVAHEWQSGGWTELRLKVVKAKDGKINVQGKAWLSSGDEPGWMISFTDAATPPSGRASLWGSPYSGTPIQYDELKVIRVIQE